MDYKKNSHLVKNKQKMVDFSRKKIDCKNIEWTKRLTSQKINLLRLLVQLLS